MALWLKCTRPELILSEGEFHGFRWVAAKGSMGYRCGYVAVPPGHPWHGKGYDEIDADVHGGLTYADHGVPAYEDSGSECWVGFDCGHCDDAPDPDLVDGIVLKAHAYNIIRSGRGVVRDQEYVETQCALLCKQALMAGERPISYH